MKAYLLSCSVILSLILVGCSSTGSNNQADTELLIYTSIYPIQYVTEEIAGEIATVESVYPPGVDAHTYEPATKEVTAIAGSDAFIYLGAGMEGFAETTAEALHSKDVSLIELGENKELFQTDTPTEDHHDHDPHIWLDPLKMIEMAALITDELIQITPDHEDEYNKNFKELETNLLALHEEFSEGLERKENKKIIVSHAAYGYWEDLYGIEQIPISGLSSGSEPSQKELTKIVKLAEENQIKYVIFEQNSSDRVSEIIQEHIQADPLRIHNLEVLTEEDLDNQKDYLSIMKENLDVLKQATQ
ncbi:MAG TPA: zinc ABC transporter substrate-binding protein [Virgibacillus sp.]|nr:zinc ABC transporter substrate-binding protein [Virgibacillus sp.]